MNILIVEPNTKISHPYSYLPTSDVVERVSSLEAGLRSMATNIPELVFVSASIATSKLMGLLDALKQASRSGLIPLIFVVDHSHKLSTIPGTTWGGKLGITTTIVSSEEFNSTIRRVCSS